MKYISNYSFVYLLILISGTCFSAGMVPQSPIVIIEESDGEGIIEIKNSDKFPNLLVTKVENTEDDSDGIITVFPPVVRVEGGETQTVRFFITSDKQLQTERLKRVTFEGIPPKNNEIEKEINVTFKQNLPVIIRPSGLPKNNKPWEGLTWFFHENNLIVENKTPYVVRFISPNVQLLPNTEIGILPKSYILPNQSFSVQLPKKNGKTVSLSNIKNIRFYPATTWGFASGKPYDAHVDYLR